MKPTQIIQEDYAEATESYSGWCTHCLEFTHISGVEPDARGYECEACNHNTLFGAEEALLQGFITFKP